VELEEALNDPELKRALRAATDAAIASRVYGVPTFGAGGLLGGATTSWLPPRPTTGSPA
jgi:hypothetical protein